MEPPSRQTSWFKRASPLAPCAARGLRNNTQKRANRGMLAARALRPPATHALAGGRVGTALAWLGRVQTGLLPRAVRSRAWPVDQNAQRGSKGASRT